VHANRLKQMIFQGHKESMCAVGNCMVTLSSCRWFYSASTSVRHGPRRKHSASSELHISGKTTIKSHKLLLN